jgi:hypothetical protein
MTSGIYEIYSRSGFDPKDCSPEYVLYRLDEAIRNATEQAGITVLHERFG